MFVLSEFIADLLLLVKFGLYFVYTVLSTWFKNIFIPSRFLYKKVDNEVVLITGAASGIGQELARTFLAHNAIVICVDINEQNLNQTVNEFKAEFRLDNQQKRLFSYRVDVSSYEQIKALVQRIRKDAGNVTILVNNAGIVNAKSLLNLNEVEIRRIFDVNILAHFWLCKEILPSMIEVNKGHIINVSSILGIVGAEKLTDYCATKFGVYGFSEALRIELLMANANNRVVVSTLCPFYVNTPLYPGVKFKHLNWLDTVIDVKTAVKQMFHYILLEKTLIYVPRPITMVNSMFKGIQFTNFNDYFFGTLAQGCVDSKKVD